MRTIDALAPAFDALSEWHGDGVFWLAGQEIAFVKASTDLAAARRLPVMVARRAQMAAGGLLSYKPNSMSLFPGVAAYADKILHGAKPGDLPVRQPTEIPLVLNLRPRRHWD